jgi:hypothetical protein
MKRAILTLVTAAVLLPMAAEIARAGGHRGKRSSEKKGVSVTAGPRGISIGYTHSKKRVHRSPRHRTQRSHREIGVTFRFGQPHPPILKRWMPGHYTIEERHIRQPDRIEKVWVPDRYQTRLDACGRPYRVLVEGSHHENRLIPGAVVVERVKIWVPGYWERI